MISAARSGEQYRVGRAELLDTGFEVFERNIRDQLGRSLGPAIEQAYRAIGEVIAIMD